jgi:very-short-patch-repair endonuclease
MKLKNSPLEGWICETKTGWKYNYSKLPKNPRLKTKAKELRQAGVLSEVLFWLAFKDKKLLGYDIDRQVIIGNYIVDFFIPELGLVFEIDGDSHNDKGEYDIRREEFLKSLHLEIVHFEDIAVKKAMDGVVGQVMLSIQNREKYIESLVVK